MQETSWEAAQLAASQEGFSAMELIMESRLKKTKEVC
jgi:hypothetical protein